MRSNFQFAANMFELDSKLNPYHESPKYAPCENKLSFVELDHKYCLYDENGGYPDDIVSASSLFQFITGSGGFFNHQPYKYHTTVPILSDVLNKYINHISSNPPSKPLSFNVRTALLDSLQVAIKSKDKKNFSQYFPTNVFEMIENWVISGNKSHNPFLLYENRVDIEEFIDYLSLNNIANQGLRNKLEEFIAVNNKKQIPKNGHDIVKKINIARDAGTLLHKYLEYRFNGLSSNDARKLVKCFEEIDYVQVDDFLSKTNITDVEKRLASYRHKICGSIDGIAIDENNIYHVRDWKRTAVFNDEVWFKVGFCRVNLSEVANSSMIVKYANQMAVYRKLLILNSYEVSDIAYLDVFHPSLPYACTIEIDLNIKLKKPTSSKNELNVCDFDFSDTCLSPIELVEVFFAERELMLKKKFHNNEK